MDLTLALLIIASLIVGIAKGGMPTAAAVSVPIVALVMNPLQAAAILLPVFLVSDWFGVWLYRREYSRENLTILVPSALFGIVLAVLIAPLISEEGLLVVTGGIGLWYCARRVLGPSGGPPAKPALIPGVLWGILTGIATFITHSGAPPMQAFLLPQRLPKLVFAGTTTILFAIVNAAKLPAYFAIGTLDGLNATMVLGLCAVGLAGVAIGRRLVLAMPEALYRSVIEGLLFVLSLILIGRAIAALAI